MKKIIIVLIFVSFAFSACITPSGSGNLKTETNAPVLSEEEYSHGGLYVKGMLFHYWKDAKETPFNPNLPIIIQKEDPSYNGFGFAGVYSHLDKKEKVIAQHLLVVITPDGKTSKYLIGYKSLSGYTTFDILTPKLSMDLIKKIPSGSKCESFIIFVFPKENNHINKNDPHSDPFAWVKFEVK